MSDDVPDVMPLEEPLAALERELIDEFLRAAGYNAEELRARGDAESRHLLVEASTYAAARLTEVETRAHYIRSLRGEV
jgi:regulator of protease activity HflC (stomatin/prohibitin superfamily)